MQNNSISAQNKDAAGQGQEAQFTVLTDTYNALFSFGHILADALPESVLQDAENPLQIAVTGRAGGGKKIIPDAVRERLFEGKASLSGRLEFDERWFGRQKGRDLEVDFLNARWKFGYSNSKLKLLPTKDKIEAFIKGREKGGVTFIHNSNIFAASAGMSIRMDRKNRKASFQFKKAAKEEDNKSEELYIKPTYEWEREITITVRDPRLLSSPEFMASCNLMTERIAAVKTSVADAFKNYLVRAATNIHRQAAILWRMTF